MTPLAQRIAKELALPRAERTFVDNCQILRRFDEVHCFECSEVFEISCDLTASFLELSEAGGGDRIGRLAFLPAPRTWLEWRNGAGRTGVLLEEVKDRDGDTHHARLRWAIQDDVRFASVPGQEGLALLGAITSGEAPGAINPILDARLSHVMGFSLYALLAMINTPRVIGRRVHQPHAGLQRALARARGLQGKFPLHAWTEIKLEVRPPRIDDGANERDVYLTGSRALHFVRAHLRIRMGRIELVSAHWRGDASLGIKQSRYKLVPPRAA